MKYILPKALSGEVSLKLQRITEEAAKLKRKERGTEKKQKQEEKIAKIARKTTAIKLFPQIDEDNKFV